jgi:anti-sigma regulatory factor (Ser/Thr protein kinase)
MLPARPSSVGAARRLLVQTLDEWELQGLEYDASVVLSELTTNAVLHAGTDVGVKISFHDSVLTLEVSDGSPKLPTCSHFNPTAATGKGLILVEALATEWGVRAEPTGKTIWATFAEAGVLERSTAAIRRLRPASGRARAEGRAWRGQTVGQARAIS